MYDRETLRSYLLGQPGAEETFPFGPIPLVAKVGGKMFALLPLDADPPTVSLKCDPDKAEFLRDTYTAIQPGYHLNKRHWITVTVDDTIDHALVTELIDESYRLVVKGLPRAVRQQIE
jgi:predicted DNA-binding protein (MmcQ/YjbR family)